MDSVVVRRWPVSAVLSNDLMKGLTISCPICEPATLKLETARAMQRMTQRVTQSGAERSRR
jgi:hypothetical protein